MWTHWLSTRAELLPYAPLTRQALWLSQPINYSRDFKTSCFSLLNYANLPGCSKERKYLKIVPNFSTFNYFASSADCISRVNVGTNNVWSQGNYVCHFFLLWPQIMWESWKELTLDVGTACALICNYVPSVRPIQHQSLPEMFIITHIQPLILRGEGKKIPDLCLHCYPFLSSFMKTKFHWIPAALTLRTAMRPSFHLHCTTQRPGHGPSTHTEHGAGASRHATGVGVKAEWRSLNTKLQADLDSRHTSYLSAAFSFYGYAAFTACDQEVNLTLIINSPKLLNTCQYFSLLPFSTLNRNSPPGLALCVFHEETGKRRRKWRIRTHAKKKKRKK